MMQDCLAYVNSDGFANSLIGLTSAEWIASVFALTLLAALVAGVVKHTVIRNVLLIACAVLSFGVLLLFTPALYSLVFSQGGSCDLAELTLLHQITLRFTIEPLGLIFALMSSFLWILATIYCIGYLPANKEAHHGRFFAFYALSLFGVMGIAFSGNLITLFIYYEVLTLATWPLVTHHETDKAKKGGQTYLAYLMGTSLTFLLAAILLTYFTTGTVDFHPNGVLLGRVSEEMTLLITVLFAFGIGKAALLPVHRWLPAAMVAPAPVSALLHAVAVVKGGVFTMVKVIVYVLGIDHLSDTGGADWLVYLAGISILFASVMALRTGNLKRMLAYSTVSQLSYVTMAAALLAPKALMAAGFHIVAHGFSKITLFLAAGAIYTASKKSELVQLEGIGKYMPWTMAAFAIGAISMIGLPPAAGFLTKYYLLQGTFEAKHWFALGVLMLSTLLNALYFGPVVIRAFWGKAKGKAHGEAPATLVVPLTLTAIATMLLFFFPEPVLRLLEEVPTR